MERAANQRHAQPGSFSLARWLTRHGYKLLAPAPFIYLACVVVRYGVDVPCWDQWDLVPLLDKMYRGRLALADVWAQHNEHRHLFPQLIILGLGRLTAWNLRYELAVNIALMLGTCAVLARQIRITGRGTATPGLRWAIPAGSLIVFSLSQYQNFLWGEGMCLLLNLLAAVGGIVVLANAEFRWRRFAGAALLGMVATYSFGNGLLFWPIGLGVLLVVTRRGRERTASIAAWLLVSLLVAGCYLWGYQKPAEHPAVNSLFAMPLAYAAYVLKFVGNLGAQYYTGPLAGEQGDGDLALIAGVLGMLALTWAGAMVLWRRLAGLKVLVPYFAMIAYTLGTAMMTGIGRVGFGSDQALESRYGTMGVPLWVSLVVLLLLLAQRGSSSPAVRAGDRRSGEGLAYYRRVAAGSLLAGVILYLGLGSLGARAGVANMSAVQANCRTALLELAAHPGALVADGSFDSQGPYAAKLIERYPVLLKHRLSLFRNRP
jgi:hypothetical protein